MTRERWTVRWRLTVWNSAVLTLLFCLFSVAMLYAVHSHLAHKADLVLKEELFALQDEVQRFTDDSETLTLVLQRRFVTHAEIHFQILGQNLQPVSRSRFLDEFELPRPADPFRMEGQQFQDIRLPQGRFRLLSMATRNAHNEPLLLQVVTPRAALRQEFSWYWSTLLIALPIAILTSVGAGHLLASQAMRPVEQMADNSRDELGRLAVTLNKMFDRLHKSMAQMKQFTSDAAHELRSPMAALMTRLEVALRSATCPEGSRQNFEELLRETNMMCELVDQLLILSRHDSGQEISMIEEVYADVLLLDVLERVRPLAESRGIELHLSTLPAWIVLGDYIGLSRVFWNLLDNATKYTSRGGEVRVSAEIRQGRWVCSIRDTGRGIPKEHLPNIFNRFYRIDYSRTRSEGGTGLGLAICKSIVEGLRGRLHVESEVGVGTEFRIELPGNAPSGDTEESGVALERARPAVSRPANA
jgi:signal transduction histidine kinase